MVVHQKGRDLPSVMRGSCMYGGCRLLEPLGFESFFAVVKSGVFRFLGKVSCWCMTVCVCASVHACEWIGAPAYGAFEKSEGRCCWNGRLCMTLMNTLIDPHEDRPHCDGLIGVYCALWLDERGHDDGCLPLWQGRRVFSEKCYLIKPVDRNILNRAQIVSSTIYRCEISLFWRVYFYLSTLSVFLIA